MTKRSCLLTATGIILSLLFTGVRAQDISYARKVIAKLASKEMRGRGYVKKGDRKASDYIAEEFRRIGLGSFQHDHYQVFSMPVNTMPGTTLLRLDGHKLEPGTEYVISSSSPGVNGTYPVQWVQTDSTGKPSEELKPGYYTVMKGNMREWSRNRPSAPEGIIVPVSGDENLMWHVSDGGRIAAQPLISIRSDRLNEATQNIRLRYRTRFVPDHETRNVIGYATGDTEPDSFIVITAHYDHLGCMGKKTCYPGANDNASGTAMMMDLARHFAGSVAPLHYTMVFMAFAAEEAGLLGSTYFADNPLFPLGNIKFLINLDLTGTGSEGITVVNGSVFESWFGKLKELNDRAGYLPEIKPRGEACNSDHCPFYSRGVPSFFIYTRGEEFTAYHNLDDRAENLPLTAYEGLFRLILDYCDALTP